MSNYQLLVQFQISIIRTEAFVVEWSCVVKSQIIDLFAKLIQGLL